MTHRPASIDDRGSSLQRREDTLRGSKYIVTGGAGYVGRVLIEELVSRGASVTAIDNELIARLPDETPAITRLVADVRRPHQLEAAFAGADGVVHLAAIVGDPACDIDTALTDSVNYEGTVAVAEACQEAGIQRMVFASTCSGYGSSNGSAADVSDPLAPLSSYARSKVHAERYLLDTSGGDFSPCILRLATIFGLSPRMRFDLVVNTMTACAVRSGEVVVHGGQQWRPFLHVRDAARAMLTALVKPPTGRAEIFNCGSDGENHRLLDVGQAVTEEVAGTTMRVRPEMVDARDYRVSFGDACGSLGSAPRVGLREGIREMRDALCGDGFHDVTAPEYHNDQLTRRFVERSARWRMSGRRPAVLGGAPCFSQPIPMTGPTLEVDARLHADLDGVLASGMLTNHRHVREFERRVAEFLAVPNVVAVASCTAGLMLTYRCLGLEGEVVTPSFTFMATGHAIDWNGLRPAYADADPATFNVDPAAAAAAVDQRTAAVTVTHVFGVPADVDAVDAEVARAAGRPLPVVVDAAHGFGARYADGEAVGAKGTAEVFSLSPTKVLTTGEGGLVATRDGALAEALRHARDYGNPGTYDCAVVGLNARMTEFAGVLGLRNLEAVPRLLEQRTRLAARYHSRLAGLPGLVPQRIPDGCVSTYKDFSMKVDETVTLLTREDVVWALAQEGIPTRTYFDPPLHRLTAYRDAAAGIELPVTDELSSTMLTLPLSAHMPEEHVDLVCDAIEAILEHREQIAARRVMQPVGSRDD